jgi:hypothetical protein
MFLSLKKLRPLSRRTTDAQTYSIFAGSTVSAEEHKLNSA